MEKRNLIVGIVSALVFLFLTVSFLLPTHGYFYTKSSLNLDTAYLKIEKSFVGFTYDTDLQPTWIAQSLAIPVNKAEGKGRWVITGNSHELGYGANYAWGSIQAQIRAIGAHFSAMRMDSKNPARVVTYQKESAEMILKALNTADVELSRQVCQYVLDDVSALANGPSYGINESRLVLQPSALYPNTLCLPISSSLFFSLA